MAGNPDPLIWDQLENVSSIEQSIYLKDVLGGIKALWHPTQVLIFRINQEIPVLNNVLSYEMYSVC